VIDLHGIARQFGGEVRGQTAKIPGIGHSAKDRSVTITDDPNAPDGCLVHCFAGDDPLAEKDRLRDAGFLPKLGEGKRRELSPAEKESLKRENEERRVREEQARSNATQDARKFWDSCEPAKEDHPYLIKKGVGGGGLRQSDSGLLVVPIKSAGEVQSTQTISQHGRKLFFKGAPMQGSFPVGIGFGTEEFVCEGYATAYSVWDALVKRAHCAFSFGNMEKIANELIKRGRNIVLVADTGKTGQDLQDIGDKLGVPVVHPRTDIDMPADSDGVVSRGTDFNDQAQVFGADDVRASIDAQLLSYREARASEADPEEDACPIDLWAAPAPPALPRGLLPEVIEDFAFENAKQTGISAGGFAISALVNCAGAITDEIRIKVPRYEDWTERACLWGMLYGAPSVKKTPVYKKATKFLIGKSQKMEKEYGRKLLDWQEDGGIKSGDPKPPKKKIVITNFTNEIALELAADNPRGMCVFADELAGIFARLEGYNAGDSSMWLEAYNGGYQSVDRKSSPAQSAENFSFCILGGTQPNKMKKLREKVSDDGMLQRFIPVVLQNTHKAIDAEAPPVNERFYELLGELLDLKPGGTCNFFKKPLQFSEEAQIVREAFTDRLFEDAELFDDINSGFANHLRKHEGLFPRMCLVWHCVEHVGGEMPVIVEKGTAERVSRFLEEFVQPHGFCFYEDLAGITEEENPVKSLGSYILSKAVDEFSLRDAMQQCTKFRKLDKFAREETLGQLEARLWIDKIKGPRADSQCFKVNPRVHEMYAERAKSEKKRRQIAAKKLLSLQKVLPSVDK